MKRGLLLIICLAFLGCDVRDVITGVGAGILGSTVISKEARTWKTEKDKVTPQEVLDNINTAYADFYARTTAIWNNTVLTQKEKQAQYQLEEKTLNSRIKSAKSLMLAETGFITGDILKSLQEAPETKELAGMLGGMLPPPWNEIIPTILLVGLSTATGVFAKRSTRLSGQVTEVKGYATLAGKMLEGFKKEGKLTKDEVKNLALVSASDVGVNMTRFNSWLKGNNIT